MLSLTRRTGEAIRLRHKRTGEIIRIVQVRTGPTQSRIAIEADQEWNIVREELLSEPAEFRHLPEKTTTPTEETPCQPDQDDQLTVSATSPPLASVTSNS